MRRTLTSSHTNTSRHLDTTLLLARWSHSVRFLDVIRRPTLAFCFNLPDRTSGQSVLALPLPSTDDHTPSAVKHREMFSGATPFLYALTLVRSLIFNADLLMLLLIDLRSARDSEARRWTFKFPMSEA